jgi:phosphoribosylformylglycinamidine (FGAM) synthase PurS component
MKITKSQLVQIIKEEAASFKKELTLKKQLAEIEKAAEVLLSNPVIENYVVRVEK